MDYQHKVFNSPSSRRRKVCTPLLWVSTLISTVLLSLLFLNLGGHTVQKPFQSYFCPNPFSVETTFRRYDEFQDISRKGDSHWDSLLTPNGGFVVLDPPSAETYGIAMFHQLHCLQMIRSTMQSLMNPNMSADGQIQHSEHHGANHHANHHANENSHAMHCFDYLRQTILCCADNSLEKPVERRKEGLVINGYGPHKCRNSDELYRISLETGLLEP